MPRGCSHRTTRQLSALGTDKVSVTCTHCGKPFQIEARYQTSVAEGKVFCSEKCTQEQNQKGEEL
jgi:hypothetical protein